MQCVALITTMGRIGKGEDLILIVLLVFICLSASGLALI